MFCPAQLSFCRTFCPVEDFYCCKRIKRPFSQKCNFVTLPLKSSQHQNDYEKWPGEPDNSKSRFFFKFLQNRPSFSEITHRLAPVRLLHCPTYTASKNYMQLGCFVILYRFLNQCFRNLAPGFVRFVSA